MSDWIEIDNAFMDRVEGDDLSEMDRYLIDKIWVNLQKLSIEDAIDKLETSDAPLPIKYKSILLNRLDLSKFHAQLNQLQGT